MRPRPLTPRKQARQPRAQVTVEALLEATGKVLATDGIERLSTNRVAEVAGVSIGSLYQYFPNKEALITGLIEHSHQELLAAVLRALAANHERSLREIAEQVLRALLETMRGSRVPGSHATLMDQIAALGLTSWFNERMLGRYVTALEQLLRLRSELATRDLRHTAYVIVHAIHGVMRGLVIDGLPEAGEPVIRETAMMIASLLQAEG